jgi:Ca-activated chloride channel homolog
MFIREIILLEVRMPSRILAIIITFIFCMTSVIKVSAEDEDQQSGKREEVIKVDAMLVNVPVIVKGKKENLPLALRADNFELYEDGVKQEISLFAAEDTPLNITLLINVGHSQQNVYFAQHAAGEFLKLVGSSDRVRIGSFGEKIDFLTEFTSDKETLARTVASLKHNGKSRLGDVLYDMALEMKQLKGRKVVLVLTDGYSISSHPQKEILTELAESGAIVYVVDFPCVVIKKELFQGPQTGNGPFFDRQKLHFINSPETDKRNYTADLDFLADVAESTGGQFFNTGVTGTIPGFMKQIFEELQGIYALGYYPSNPVQNGGFRKIKILLRDKIKASLRYKKGYDASVQKIAQKESL